TRSIELNIPLVSAPMDTVTEAALAIALAQEGGIGVIHKNLSIENQAREVEKVKRSENGVIVDPITLPPTATIGTARKVMREYNVSGIPIVEGGDESVVRNRSHSGNGQSLKLVGIMTRRDLKFQEDDGRRIGEVVTKEGLITAPEETTLDEAERILFKAKVEKLLLVDKQGRLAGLITMRDIDKLHQFPQSCKDRRGRLRVGAATGVRDFARVEALINADVDVVVVDTAHGHSNNVLETVKEIKRRWEIQVIAGLDESPGELVIHQGRRYKTYRGMGSMGAMVSGSKDRYGQASVQNSSKLVPEGVEGRVPYRGSLGDFVYQLVGGLRAGMGY